MNTDEGNEVHLHHPRPQLPPGLPPHLLLALHVLAVLAAPPVCYVPVLLQMQDLVKER